MKAIYPGSFNPIHSGHIDIIMRAALLFDEVIVAVSRNSNKTYKVSAEQRAELIKHTIECCKFKNVRVVIVEDMPICSYAIQNNIDVIIRGFRAGFTIEEEGAAAYVNRNNGIETMFFLSNPLFTYISSSGIRECIKFNLRFDEYVPPYLEKKIKEVYVNACK